HNDSTVNRIMEERFIRINGIEQWVTIKGDRTKPVILFLHGGPGSPLSPYADAIYSKWEKDFILVQWDQRGAGKTFGHTAPAELSPDYLKSNLLTIEQMTADGIELAKYLIKYLGKQKIILFGTSWGSALGVKMVVKDPGLFYAYVGHSQVVNPIASLVFGYQKVYAMAQSSKDQKSLAVLNSIGKPPYDTAKNAGRLLRIIKKYQQINTVPAPDSWMQFSIEYNNDKDNQNRSDGDDYSFINYMGDKKLGIVSMSSTIDLLKDDFVFKIPVYLIQGEEDILTPEVITKEYFKKIIAPKKKYILLRKTEHGFNLSAIEMQYKIMKEYLQPLINR
ncbi:MAG TPA: alpha/beta hydrolase, partial [Ginsengibacter sp.]